MSDRFRTVLLFGAPGSGKGTQGKILGTIPGYYHCACGDVFRNIDVSSELGKIFYEHSSRGELVPDDVTVRIWKEAIDGTVAAGLYKPKRDLLVLDGIPRTVEQAQIMDQHIDVLKVIFLSCNDEQAMFDRLRRRALRENRHDDADEKVIRNRWKVYEQETEPVLEHYPKDKVAQIDAVQSPASVLRDVLNVIMPIQEDRFQPFAA
jgi:adenylate kinase